LSQKNNFKKSKKIFGRMKKINSSLHRKTKLFNNNMQRKSLHIDAANWTSPGGFIANCGACYDAG
jgi:hypothetical protein